ncbi:hypothetical protein [Streptomyces acidiscabies]|uniref:Uncharacterized protein n=1 Tax=Streptomyces acidiscabies TaxID=42234 RepID=A0AAP6BNT2_9ACTN|nr:hypothetical protein [Streptomyces acidiscabies]MBP5938277.1 hypothetical protein [Streptomyces sp. LBUM 1476]MBZ3909300.1 hypothetical protein [Streptomyces acidiscabies]MDX2967477.1 hypothetical protein [Streptomyces acidiscabies]MDX3016292.1 hypothetical protein [Streptomyces acidiscabies]MDX3796885.1 hypothetical protein [Streptomyces acidiscabies]
MLDEATLALAASVGTAVAQAAGTDAWTTFRDRLASTLGRGNAEREAAQRERLDRTAGRGEETAAAWRTRTEDLLEDLPPAERAALEAQLKALVREFNNPGIHGNLFLGNTAIQHGNDNIQVNRFGPHQ